MPDDILVTCTACEGNGNYLGQDFYGVQPCPTCHGSGWLSGDSEAAEQQKSGPLD